MSVFGEKLKRLREINGQTQEDIAKLLRISRAAVSKYESGGREPDIETIKVLAQHFNVSVDYIFGLMDEAENTVVPANWVKESKGSYSAGTGSSNAAEIDNILKDRSFARLAAKIKEHNLDIKIIENIVDNMLALKNSQKHP